MGRKRISLANDRGACVTNIATAWATSPIGSGVSELLSRCNTDRCPLPVVTQMKGTPVEDFFARHGHLREDGRMVHDMFQVQVKKPEASTSEWDLYEVLATIPAGEAFRPLSEGNCTLVKKGT